MAIADGMRTHDEGVEPRYRMPDLLTKEEMRLYFAGTYNIDIEFKPLSDDMKEKVGGVGVLPVSAPATERDREHDLLRQQLGIKDLEAKLDVLVEGRVKELDSKIMTREDFENKYGSQPEVKPPSEETDEEKASPDNSDEVDGPVPTYDTNENTTDEDLDSNAVEGTPAVNPLDRTKHGEESSNPSTELDLLLNDVKRNDE